jgi:maltose phosphorylase
MAGTWMSIVKGFGGMRVINDVLHFKPFIPSNWNSYSFRVEFRGRVIKLRVTRKSSEALLVDGEPLEINLSGKTKTLQLAEPLLAEL